MSLLLIKNDGLGDLILASGLIGDLAKAYGDVDLLTCAANREIAEMIPGLRKRIYCSRDAIRFRSLPLRLGVRWKTGEPCDRAAFQHLRSTRYDHAICLRRFIRVSTLVLMATVRAAEKSCAWQFPTNCSTEFADTLSKGWRRFSGPPELLSELDYYRQFLRDHFQFESSSPPRLANPTNSTDAPDDSAIGLVIGGSSTNWPQSHWLELARRLHERGYKLQLFGGPDAGETASILQAQLGTVCNYVGKLSFQAAIPHLSRLKLLIGNDTGFTHFASLYTPRCLVVLGGGTFGRFFPWPEAPHQFVIFHGLDCFDCTWQCRHERRECLHRVTAHDVVVYTDDIISGSAKPNRNLAAESCHYEVGWRNTPSPGVSIEIPNASPRDAR
jgi:ADP-heptose:LPS heptosyltransferase